MPSPQYQRGSAILTAILIMSLATMTAIAMTSQQQFDIRRAENILYRDQAGLYLQGEEAWAAAILEKDRKSNDVDAKGEDWATVLPPIPVEGGQIAGSIEDLQGRFNLNNLVHNGAVSTMDMRRFQALLTAVNLSPDLANAVLDWLDQNDEVTVPGGAEDNDYLQRPLAYRAANRPMTSPSELLQVAGFDAAAYEKLAPYVTALPDYTTINVNTASPFLLTVLIQGLSLSDAKVVQEAGGKRGYASVDAFAANPTLTGKIIIRDGLSINSRYFLLSGQAIIGQVHARTLTMLERTESGLVKVLQRDTGG